MKSKEKTLKERLLKYSALASATLAAVPTQAAVVYTDIQDVTLTSTTNHFIDLNNDGVDDFQIMWINFTSGRGGLLMPLGGNQALGTVYGTSSSYFYPKAMSFGNMVSANQTAWIGNGYQTLAGLGIYTSSGNIYYSGYYGNWFGATNKYLGLRVRIGTDWHYGWVRMDVGSTADFLTIKDFAFESVPNTAILAGDMGTTTGFNLAGLIGETGLCCTENILQVDTREHQLRGAVVEVHSINGQLVRQAVVEGNRLQLPLYDLRKGLYMAVLRSEEGVMSRKIVVE
ncbi:MAG TPA: T9SS type A sorting domain-containing protein [Bacteroidales bacterium]|nr:T9SS type A sorting domain-containing protein [Bacteroidales bacterium]